MSRFLLLFTYVCYAFHQGNYSRFFKELFLSQLPQIRQYYPHIFGDWKGKFTSANNVCNYAITVHIDQTDSTLIATFRYELPGGKYIVWDFKGTITQDSTIVLIEQKKKPAATPDSNEIANNSSMQVSGKLTRRLSDLSLEGQWKNDSINSRNKASYTCLPNCQSGLFSISRKKHLDEVIEDELTEKVTNWAKPGKYETTVDHAKRIQDTATISKMKSWNTNIDLRISLSSNPFEMKYDKSTEIFTITADGCEPFFYKVKIDTAECFENAFLQQSKNNKNIIYRWDDNKRIAVIDSFCLEFPCEGRRPKYCYP